ncbi:MAG: Uma2 family endonuclease [Chloroflexi bacterium]|nr:Uma2 family endonuclease [Chloroflexota bacterium]
MIQPKLYLTPEEYLAVEETSRDKHEYWFGETYMMAGTSINHNQIVNNTFKAFDRKLEGQPCRVFTSDIRLRSLQDDVYTYPDVMVICGEIEIDPRQQDTVMNPQVIVEVWSDSTQDYDCGAKFKMYRKIPSLREYVMIDQAAPYIEHYRRDGHFWVLETLEGMDAKLRLRSLDCEIDLAEIYRQVEWAEPKPKARKRKK